MVDTFTLVMGVVQMVIIGIGFLGNVATFIVFSRRTFRKNSISTYCQALAIFESLTVVEIINYVNGYFLNTSLAATSDALCKIFNFIPRLYSSIPAWIIVAFSFDKMISMRRKSFPILKKKYFQISLVFVIVLAVTILYIGVPIMLKRVEIDPGFYVCDITFLNWFGALMLLSIFDTCLLPFLVMIIFSILTYRSLVKSRNSVERIGNVNKERRSRDTKYAISSIAFNFMFVTFKLPIVVFFILTAYTTIYNVYFYNFAIILFFFNSSSGFFVHLATNSLFRREISILLGLNKDDRVILSTMAKTHRTNRLSCNVVLNMTGNELYLVNQQSTAV